MRKREREITDETRILDILDRAQVIHLGLSDEGQPYVVPMNYGYTLVDGKLTFYLHGATEGYKYEVLRKNSRISFSIECDVKSFEGRVACQYGMVYSSIITQKVLITVTNFSEQGVVRRCTLPTRAVLLK